MSHTHRLRGFGPKEVLLAILVLAAFSGVFIVLVRRTEDRNLLLAEAGRMRQVYIGLSVYEGQYDSQPAPNLVAVFPYNPNRADYLSYLDPFRDGAQPQSLFPIDPGLDNSGTSPVRISFSYLLNFVRTGKLSVKPWEQTRQNPAVGEIANEWLGFVEPGSPFHANVAGRVLRIDTDGAVYKLKDRGGPKPLGDAQDLFIRR